MITINTNTKIAAIIKQHPDALEAIISLSSRFEKLRNPVLRKLMAGRTSVAMASKIGGCSVSEFFEKLEPLGFHFQEGEKPVSQEKKEVPDFISSLKRDQLHEFDVRPLIGSGNDPLRILTEKFRALKTGEALRIINTFEPVPLILMMEKQGFEVYSNVMNDNYTKTWFYKKSATGESLENNIDTDSGWVEKLAEYRDKLQIIDVRDLEMPMPMMKILLELDNLPPEKALYVYHKRIPVFLLPEIALRKFGFRIKQFSEHEVHLLIFKV